MLCSLCDFRKQKDQVPMPMFCTMESFWSTKAALDWIYDQPSTRDRLDDYTLYPIEALIAVIYENFYNRAQFKCELGVLMGFASSFSKISIILSLLLLEKLLNNLFFILVHVIIMLYSKISIVLWHM